MTSNTDTLKTALHRALALAEAAGDTARVAALRALWPALERRRAADAAAAWPRYRERRRRLPPRLAIDDEMVEAWLRGGSPPPR